MKEDTPFQSEPQGRGSIQAPLSLPTPLNDGGGISVHALPRGKTRCSSKDAAEHAHVL